MSESGASLGNIPLSILAPGFRVFGDKPKRVWPLRYALGAGRVHQLDDRWVVDMTDVPQGGYSSWAWDRMPSEP